MINIAKLEVMLEGFAQKYLSPWFAIALRLMVAYPRYWFQLNASRQGYQKFADRYSNSLIFVAGLPKSGTTWLEQVLASYEGFSDIYLPEIFLYELKNGDKLDFELPQYIFDRFAKSLVVIKTHIRGLPQNVEVLRKSGVRYAVVYRDLRDVAISYFFFVRNRPWHPEYKYYYKLTPNEGLRFFANRTLEVYSNWIREWKKNRDLQTSIEIKYEDMLNEPAQMFSNILHHFELDNNPDTIEVLLKKFQLQDTSSHVSEMQTVHFRKGVHGDWVNYMDNEMKDLYKEKIGDLLIELNYENDKLW